MLTACSIASTVLICIKDNVKDFKQMFQREIACTAVAAHNVHEWKHAGRVQEGGTGAICFGDATGFICTIGKARRDWAGGVGYSLGALTATRYG